MFSRVQIELLKENIMPIVIVIELKSPPLEGVTASPATPEKHNACI